MKVKPPINALAQYLMALAAVIGCYSLYFRHAVPVIEGPPNLIQRPVFTPLAELPSPREEKSHLAPYLPTDSWELSDCKTLLTESGTILFKDFEEQPDGSLKVVPFTLFSGLDESENASKLSLDSASKNIPTVLRCIDGANLKFDRPITEVYAGEGKPNLEAASLTGNVDIYRPPSSPKANDALHIMTSNVQIDKQRIYTLDNVQFVFGPNKASGRNLLIDLEHEQSPLGADFSNITGVRRLELAFLHKLRMEPVGSNSMILNEVSTNGFKADQRTGQKKMFSNQKSPIEVACDGPFVFDFDTNVATFEQGVVAQQMDRFQDSIECEKLTLTFKRKEENENSKLTQKPEPQTALEFQTSSSIDQAKGDLELTSFLAQGNPAIVVSRSNSAQVTGELLSYNVVTSEIVGRCSQQSGEMVTIVSDKYQIVSKELRYVVPENESLGAVNANGPGRMIRPKTIDQDEFFASWTKSLTTANDPKTPGLHRVLLDGDTSVRIADQTQANANQIEVLVWQAPIIGTRPTTLKQKNWDYQPFKIVARENVSIVSPEFSGFSQKMTAIWPRRTAGPVQPKNSISRAEHRVGYRGSFQIQGGQRGAEFSSSSTLSFSQLTTPQATPFRSTRSIASEKLSVSIGVQNAPVARPNLIPTRSDFVELATFDAQPETEQSILSGSPQQQLTTHSPNSDQNAKPIEFRGQDVEVRLRGDDKETQIVDLTVIGDVRVVQKPSQSNDGKPVLIKGDQLRLTPQDKDNYRAVISSKPGSWASISAEEFELFGSDINLDQEANKLWVKGAGSMKIDPESLRDQSGKPAVPINAAPKDSVSQNLDVRWKGGMIFDGTKIYFERNVIMSAALIGKPSKDGKSTRSQLKSASEGLSVELTEPLDFAELSKNSKTGNSQSTAKIRELILVSDIPESKQAFQLAGHTPVAQPKNQFVTVENRTFNELGTLIQKQNITVPNATFNVEGGRLYAKGPGTVATHRMGSFETDGANSLSRIARTGKKKGLSFIQINFDGELNIDPDQKEMIVDGNVRTIYAPVGSWQQIFNPDDGRKSAPRESVNLRCNRLQMAQWSPRADSKPVNEMLATGNAHLFSETFEATANRVSYSQASDVLVVEGTPRTDANLWFKQAPNDKNPTHLIAEKISYRISDQWTQTQGVKNLNINSK